MRDIEFRMSNDVPWSDSLGLYIRSGDAYALRVEFGPLEAGAVLDPVLNIPNSSAQQLIDELWRCGLRPSEGSGSAGAMAATQRHLDDMRKLLSHSIGAPL